MTWLLEPIYGQVCTMHNRVRMAATVGMTAADFLKNMNFDGITRSWFWRGIPRKLGHAVVLGSDYQKLWPDFLRHAKLDDGFAFATTTHWAEDEDLGSVVGATPTEIMLLPGEGMGNDQKYPEVWPFGPPFG